MAEHQRREGGQNSANNREQRRGRRDERRNARNEEKENNYIERVVAVNRVAKVVKGGRRFSFTALVVVGDGKGMVGVGYGKAKEVPAAISKGVEEARKNFFRVPIIGTTIPHPVQGEDSAGVVMMPPVLQHAYAAYRPEQPHPEPCHDEQQRLPDAEVAEDH